MLPISICIYIEMLKNILTILETKDGYTDEIVSTKLTFQIFQIYQ